MTEPQAASPWVSDEVWASLDPFAGRASRRSVLRFLIATASVSIVAIAVGVAAQLAFWSPRVAVAGGGYSTSARVGSQRIETTFALVNNGSRSATITSLTTSGNLRLLAVTGLPHRLAAHATSGMITARVQVNDCNATVPAARDLSVTLDRPFGHVTDSLDLQLANPISTACKRR